MVFEINEGPRSRVRRINIIGNEEFGEKRVEEIVGLFAAFVGQVRAVRRLGSAAIDLCYVAAGRLDGFWESDLKAWDIAGGALIVEEAGGTITNMAGEPFTSRGGHVLATNGHLHAPMLEVIVGFREGRALKRTV